MTARMAAGFFGLWCMLMMIAYDTAHGMSLETASLLIFILLAAFYALAVA